MVSASSAWDDSMGHIQSAFALPLCPQVVVGRRRGDGNGLPSVAYRLCKCDNPVRQMSCMCTLRMKHVVICATYNHPSFDSYYGLIIRGYPIERRRMRHTILAVATIGYRLCITLCQSPRYSSLSQPLISRRTILSC